MNIGLQCLENSFKLQLSVMKLAIKDAIKLIQLSLLFKLSYRGEIEPIGIDLMN